MITEFDLDKAIAECQGVPNPNAKTCMLLASFLTIKKEMFGKVDQLQYSFDSPPQISIEEDEVETETDFKQMLAKKSVNDVFDAVEDLMNTLELLNPKLYRKALNSFESLDNVR